MTIHSEPTPAQLARLTDAHGAPAPVAMIGAHIYVVRAVDEFGALLVSKASVGAQVPVIVTDTYNPGALPELEQAVRNHGGYMATKLRAPKVATDTTAESVALLQVIDAEATRRESEPVFTVSMTAAVLLLRAHHNQTRTDHATIGGSAEFRAAQTLADLGMVTRPHHAVIALTDRGRAWTLVYGTVVKIEGAAHAAAARAGQSAAELDHLDATRAALVNAIRRLFKISKAKARAAAAEYADQGEGLLRAVGTVLGRY